MVHTLFLFSYAKFIQNLDHFGCKMVCAQAKCGCRMIVYNIEENISTRGVTLVFELLLLLVLMVHNYNSFLITKIIMTRRGYLKRNLYKISEK